MHETEHRDRRASLAVALGLVANIILAALKTLVGVLGHSPALLADGINSTSDVAYYLVIGVFMRLARKPADEEHPYGHRQLESVAALVVGAFVVSTAIAIFWDAVSNVYELAIGEESYSGAAIIALWVALFTVVLKIALAVYTRGIARQTENAAVMALAFDHRNDLFSASAAAIGIYLGRAGYPWVDPLVGALVAMVILLTGLEILRSSSYDLMGAVPSETLAQQIEQALVSVEDVREVEEIQAHRFGPYMVVTLTIGVDGDLSVSDGDCIASSVEHTLYHEFDYIRRVHVHYHPCRETHVRAPVGVTVVDLETTPDTR